MKLLACCPCLWYHFEPEIFDNGGLIALEKLTAIFQSKEVALPCLAKELEGCLLKSWYACCSSLRAVRLSPDYDAREKLEALCGKNAKNTGEAPFDEAKSTFMRENYPNLTSGLHAHPDIYIQEGLDFTEASDQSEDWARDERRQAKMFDFLSEQFKSDICFIFQKFNTSVDQRVVNDFCDQLTKNLEAGSTSVKEAEEQMRNVSGLILLDWERIKQESGSHRNSSEERSTPACRHTIAMLKSHLKNNGQASFLVVNLSLATVIYIHLYPKSDATCQKILRGAACSQQGG